MTDQQALNNLEIVCRSFRGTLDEHQALQSALAHVKARLAESTSKTETEQPLVTS